MEVTTHLPDWGPDDTAVTSKTVPLVKKSTRKRIAKTWGYVLLPVLAYGWWSGRFGYALLAVLSLMVASFFLFQARVPCCAENREVRTSTGEPTLCRNNGKGLLRGCWIEAHKWHNAKMFVSRSQWARLVRGLFRKFSGGAATVSACAALASAAIAGGSLLVATLTYRYK